jgi:large subunit ribosomal protein L1
MTKLTKKQKASDGKVDSNKLYAVADALELVKQYATAKFDESIDVAVQLGIDAKKSDQVVRGAVVLPNGTGKTKRVAVFAQGVKAEEAWPLKSKPARWTSMSSSRRRTRCASSAPWVRCWARAA